MLLAVGILMTPGSLGCGPKTELATVGLELRVFPGISVELPPGKVRFDQTRRARDGKFGLDKVGRRRGNSLTFGWSTVDATPDASTRSMLDAMLAAYFPGDTAETYEA